MSLVILTSLKEWVGKIRIAPHGQELLELPAACFNYRFVFFDEDFAFATHCQNQVSFRQVRIDDDPGKGG